ncbi:TetR/AcrR family transcriptional regulator [Pseudonocardia acidicola]|uniref:Helix-turn-helix transcriptional regulator n=1 Tax=Pseudonocardia acidicola TaxID=2724939 RepID=A0ABX1S6X7_9PSEU|nr:TetR/AcrR family transcriptional regulator [Pseudonocardia acidicola]NMH97314.1 helix-turn-helix transcriptional regulator [Pseudonocardia acidicola]
MTMAGTGSSASARRPLGRPRRDGSPPAGPVPDVIVTAAAKLFTEQGYAATTMTQIARAAGLRQSSLYYWFSRKEQILQAALTVNRLALTHASVVAAGDGTPGLRLFRLLRYDTLQLCLSPWDFTEIEQLAEAQPDDFADFWRDYDALVRHVAGHIRDGIASGEFRTCDAELAAMTALTLNEGLQKRYRAQSRHGSGENPFSHAPHAAAEYALTSASTTLAALSRRPSTVPRLAARAAALDPVADTLRPEPPRPPNST